MCVDDNFEPGDCEQCDNDQCNKCYNGVIKGIRESIWSGKDE